MSGGSITSLSPLLVWESAGTEVEHYIVSLGLAFDALEEFEVSQDTFFQINGTLLENSTYYLSIEAIDRFGYSVQNEAGLIYFFTNILQEPPIEPVIICPDSVVVLTSMPQFVWSESADPDPLDSIRYILRWWSLEAGVDSLQTDTNITTLPYPLVENSNYMWNVTAFDLYGGSALSDVGTFWVNEESEPPRIFSLSFPENFTTGLPANISFSWEMSDDPDPFDAIHYELLIAQDSLFNHVVSRTITTEYQGVHPAESLSQNTEYWWRVIASDLDSLMVTSETFSFEVGFTSIVGADPLPEKFFLHQNYPNPFNSFTKIPFEMPSKSKVTLTVFDTNGRLIRTIDYWAGQPGWYSIVWDAKDDDGASVPTGVYILSAFTDDARDMIKVLVLK